MMTLHGRGDTNPYAATAQSPAHPFGPSSPSSLKAPLSHAGSPATRLPAPMQPALRAATGKEDPPGRSLGPRSNTIILMDSRPTGYLGDAGPLQHLDSPNPKNSPSSGKSRHHLRHACPLAGRDENRDEVKGGCMAEDTSPVYSFKWGRYPVLRIT